MSLLPAAAVYPIPPATARPTSAGRGVEGQPLY
jgi:hypothetical protein